MIDRSELHMGVFNREGLSDRLPKRIRFCDVTLREGDQTPGVRLSLADKTTLARRVRRVADEYANPVLLGAHCHNDYGCATANTLACLEEGVELFDVAVNGLGERAGNADLVQSAVLFETVYGVDTGIDCSRLVEISRTVADMTNRPVPSNRPFVGDLAYADHEGIHLEAYLHQPFAFQGFRPEIIGNRRRFLLGIFAGKASVRVKLDEMGEHVPEGRLAALADRVRNAAAETPGGLVSDDVFLKMVTEVKEETDA